MYMCFERTTSQVPKLLENEGYWCKLTLAYKEIQSRQQIPQKLVQCVLIIIPVTMALTDAASTDSYEWAIG